MIGEAGQKTHRIHSQELKIEITATKTMETKGTIVWWARQKMLKLSIHEIKEEEKEEVV